MAASPTRIQIGELLRQDATGAWHAATLGDTPHTLRILRADLAESDEARLVFEQEMRRIERLVHPALVRVHRASRKPPRPWLLTDPINGSRLTDVLETEGPLPMDAARDLAARLHDALRYLDERKQVHAAPWPDQWVRVGDDWKLPTFRAVRARDGLKNLKRRKDPHAEWTPPEHAKEHEARLAAEPWIAWAVGTLLRTAGGGVEALAPAVARLCDPDPARRPAGRRAVEAALGGGDGPAPSNAPAIKAPVPRRKRKPRDQG